MADASLQPLGETHAPAVFPPAGLRPAVCAGLAWLGSFWLLLQIDVPLIRFERSIHIGWLERLGDIGSLLGHGTIIAGVGIVLAAVGWFTARAQWYRAGVQNLAAYLLTTILAHALKHLIGRPRPRMMHGDSPLLGPTFGRGLESFPSGHASVTFAAATVLSVHFPACRVAALTLAVFVAASRVVRGSHFPTDVLAGATLGVIIGRLVSHPWPQWRAETLKAFVDVTPIAVAAAGVLWIACQPAATTWHIVAWQAIGGLFVLTAASMRVRQSPGRSEAGIDARGALMWRAVAAIGVGFIGASVWAPALAVLAAASQWPVHQAARFGPPHDEFHMRSGAVLEAVIMLTAAGAVYALRGVLPIL